MLSNFSSSAKTDLGYMTFGRTAMAVTSVGGNILNEFRSGPRRISRDTLIGNTNFLLLSDSLATTSATRSYLMYEREFDEPSFDVGGNDPGNRCENGYA